MHQCCTVPSTTADLLNILLVGTCDIRHVLKTVCFARRHSVRALRFFVFDETMECLARHILLMSIASESDINIPERGQLLLELHGNALLRSKTRSYLADKATEFMKSLTSSPELLNRFDLSQLKHKERDALEDVFRFWKAAKTADFDMSKLRYFIFVHFHSKSERTCFRFLCTEKHAIVIISKIVTTIVSI
jgi:hypothetical protein